MFNSYKNVLLSLLNLSCIFKVNSSYFSVNIFLEVFMAGALKGIRIIDLTSMISGPSATMILGDQDAEIIKIENTSVGDYTRIVSTQRFGISAAYLNNNRNKKSVCIDLKAEEGKNILKKLIGTADVLVQNFRPGVMDRLGFGYSDVRTISPNIIYVSISGFGFTGPYKNKPVYDPLIQALSGLTTVQAGSDEERPRLMRTILPDKLTGFATAQAITAALFHKAKTGEGQEVKISMLDAVISFLWGSDMGGHTFVGDELEKETAQSFIDLIYETKEGFISVAVQSDKEWFNICDAFNKKEWLSDPRFLTAELRHQNINERLELIQSELKKKTSDEWLKLLTAKDVPCAPVLTRKEMIKNEQVVANDIIKISEHPIAGKIRQSKLAASFSVTNKDDNLSAPTLGQHTKSVLSGLGFTELEVDRLLSDKVIKGS
jgi:crotonobetainyl-CoA:carnitine CoA-transferase CaiB-like acyl-CoA transferase